MHDELIYTSSIRLSRTQTNWEVLQRDNISKVFDQERYILHNYISEITFVEFTFARMIRRYCTISADKISGVFDSGKQMQILHAYDRDNISGV